MIDRTSLHLHRALALALALATCALSLLPALLPEAGATPRARSTGELAADANRAFGIERSRVVRMALPREPGRSLAVQLPFEDVPAPVLLVPFSVRSDSHQVLVPTADGSLAPAPPAPMRTLRGEVEGLDGSFAAGSLLDDGLHLRVLLPDGGEIWMEPISRRVPGARAGDHVAYRGSDVLPTGGTCEARLVPAGAGTGGTASASGEPATAESLQVAEVAIDADHEYYLDYGSSVTAVQDRIESIINTVNIQYERDVAITHTLGTMIVRTAEPDPYTSTDAGTLLNEFRNHWNANQGGIARDVAHLFTGKSINGGTIGIAWVGVICNSFYGYGLSESDFNGNFSSATDLTAHELGHNWNAGHCSCTSHTMNPYITSSNIFHPTLTIPTIESFRDSRSCLSVEVSQPPPAPSGLGATAVSDSAIDLAWTDNDTTGLGFDIERSEDGGSTWIPLASVSAATTTYTDTGLNADTTYTYRVFAYNAAGSSAASNLASATTASPPPPPAAPTGLGASTASESEIDLAWNDVADESGYKVERSGDGGITWSEIGQTGQDGTIYADTGLAAATTFHYRVRAFNGAGDSGYSNVDSATTADPPAFVDQLATGEFFVAGSVNGNYTDTWADDGVTESLTERPSGGKPSQRHSYGEHVLEFDVQPGAAVTVFVEAWGGTAEDSFLFAVSTDGGSTYEDMFLAPLTGTGAAQSFPLDPATSGSVLVRVTDTDQTATRSSLETVFIDHAFVRTDLAPGAKPAAPTGLSATAGTSSLEVQVGWTDVAVDEFGYELERSPDGSTWAVIANLAADTTSYLDLDVGADSTYHYRARAFNGAGYSGYSNTDSAITTSAPAGIALSGEGYKLKGVQHVDLTWTGGGGTVEIRRDGIVVATIANGGSYTDNIGTKGGGSYLYEVCEVGGGTCSNTLPIAF